MRLPEGLPEIKGRWLSTYKVLWWVMLVLAVVGSTAGTWATFAIGRAQDRALYGAGLRLEMNHTPYTFAPISPEARAAGIVAGSTLLAVNGRPVTGGGDLAAAARLVAALEGRDGQILELSMRAPGGTVAMHRIVRGPQHLAAADREAPVPYEARIAFNITLQVAVSAIAIFAAILLFLRRKGDPVVALLSLALLGFTSGVESLLHEPALREWTGWTLNIVATISFCVALATFPAGRFEPRFSLLVVPLALALAISSLPLSTVPPAAGGLIASSIMVFLFAVLAVRYRRLDPGVQRQQMKWAVLGLAMLAIGMPTAFILSLLDRSAQDNWQHFALLFAGNLLRFLSMLGFVAGLLVSLLRHRLYDADAAISRSALYGGLTVALVAIFAGFEKLIETLGEEWYGGSVGAAAGALAAALAALFLVPLHHRMSHWAERRFQQDIAAMRAKLPELLAELRDSENPRELAGDALRLALRGVRAAHGAIVLAFDEESVLADAQGIGRSEAEAAMADLPVHSTPGLERIDDSVFPLRLSLLTPGGTLAGWLLLGPHPDGSLYGKDDREALEEIASPLARALALALERARRADARRAETLALRETMDAVARRLAEIAERIAPASRTRSKPRTVN